MGLAAARSTEDAEGALRAVAEDFISGAGGCAIAAAPIALPGCTWLRLAAPYCTLLHQFAAPPGSQPPAAAGSPPQLAYRPAHTPVAPWSMLAAQQPPSRCLNFGAPPHRNRAPRYAAAAHLPSPACPPMLGHQCTAVTTSPPRLSASCMRPVHPAAAPPSLLCLCARSVVCGGRGAAAGQRGGAARRPAAVPGAHLVGGWAGGWAASAGLGWAAGGCGARALGWGCCPCRSKDALARTSAQAPPADPSLARPPPPPPCRPSRNLQVPGFSSRDVRPYQRAAPSADHQRRLAAVRRAMAATSASQEAAPAAAPAAPAAKVAGGGTPGAPPANGVVAGAAAGRAAGGGKPDQGAGGAAADAGAGGGGAAAAGTEQAGNGGAEGGPS